MNKTKHLTQRLRTLAVVSSDQLARVAGGGETASTSTSGTPEAGDDTVGDSSGGHGPSTSFSLNFAKIEFEYKP